MSEESIPGSPPILTVLAGVPTAAFPMGRGAMVAGRSPEAELPFPNAEVSRRHCRFQWDGQSGCTVEDLGSRWGTSVNGTALPGGVPSPLQPGDLVQIGPVLVHYGFGPPPEGVANALAADAGLAPGSATILIGGHEVQQVPLGRKRLVLGRAADADVVLADPGVSRQHAVIERTPSGYEVADLQSRAGSLVNGRRFEKHLLVIGDRVQLGPFFFRFDGQTLTRTSGRSGVEIEAHYLHKQAGATAVLTDVSLRVERGQFVMILGPSGAGKSSLLDTLTGLRPADSGEVRYDGADFYADYDRLRAVLGYVPQDDIVHRELTVAEALLFSARLRLPAATPAFEIRKLVAQTITRLGLADRRHTPIAQLSGGERKRVSVGVELLSRPSVLFLDEPTSGLDPAAEFKLMELLRHLADGGCTVVCTTHVVENVYLADRLFVVASGRLIFDGNSQEARETFGVQKLTNLYDRLAERTPFEWAEDHERRRAAAPDDRRDVSPEPVAPGGPRRRRGLTLPILWARQWTILAADRKNFFLLLGQPLVIALLVAWATDDTALGLFFAYLSTLWFGCSNAAQEIVREIAVYRREHMAGLGRHSYLLSKLSLLGTLTAAQGLFLYGCLWTARWFLYRDPDPGVARGIDGSALWQMGSLVGTAFASVGIGLAISALARSTMQAVMAVPLVLIPQILFSGLVVETNQMTSPVVYALTSAMPSYAAQTMMDVGAFLNRPITGVIYNAHKKAGDHLKDLWLRELVAHPATRNVGKGELRARATDAFRTGQVYRLTSVGTRAAGVLLAWVLAGYLTAASALRARERG